ncbi:MAG: tRNA preQ1(34) S-adenosylmethionine ribosyltransferase-isomerase QueA [Acidimicrobiia bacterium]|nr:tRNA preQ1(34) S-adenosylmethionine ribosyltransferase-isomerase QueA [Acidimicrobiia bacterium]
MKTDDFDYELPVAAIAQHPIEPRDAARLLLADNLEDRQFRELPDLLQSGDLLVVNRTRVRAARLRGTKRDSGGSVELLLTRRRDETHWEGLIRPARRVRAGTLLDLGRISGEVTSDPDRGEVVVALQAPGRDIEQALADEGEIPLPPYIHVPLSDDSRYQTVFARTLGSAAAPTAALHFTTEVLERLEHRGVAIAEVELDIGLDTFRPISAEAVQEHPMHREAWRVPAKAATAVSECRRRGGRVIAVGTTVVRTLESAAHAGRTVAAGGGDTDLFITPGYQMQVVDCVITNFHAPRTTLIVMIAALLGERWREVYEHALAAGYRFLSFGDAMLIEHPVNRP